ncbi:MAG: cytochrome c biogenesis protein ResB [Vampirovibrionales bacterium]|nr:cytochrome c biogenesis protein ResB [Vampirovibrionales bacterium]
MTAPSPRRDNFWLPPYGYAQAAALAAGVWSAGTLLQTMKGSAPPLNWPWNAVTLGAFVLALTLSYRVVRKTALGEWVTSVPFALCVFGALMAMAVVGGVVPQTPDVALPALLKGWGWHQMFQSWPFALMTLLLLACLGWTILKNFSWRSRRWMATSLSHLGVWVTIAAALFGAGDLRRLDMALPEGQASHVGADSAGRVFPLPFEAYLQAFELDEYPPTALWLSAASGEPLAGQSRAGEAIAPGATFSIAYQGARYQAMLGPVRAHGRWARDVRSGQLTFIASDRPSDAPAAYATLVKTMEATSREPQKPNAAPGIRSGWITRGGATSLPQVLTLDGVGLAMAEARPKRYASRLIVRESPAAAPRAARVEVNHPLSINGWRLYQKSYEQPLGMGQSISVLEAIRDPWLPVVYAGLVLMLAGAALALMRGSDDAA